MVKTKKYKPASNEFIPEKIWVQFANKIEKLYD